MAVLRASAAPRDITVQVACSSLSNALRENTAQYERPSLSYVRMELLHMTTRVDLKAQSNVDRVSLLTTASLVSEIIMFLPLKTSDSLTERGPENEFGL